MIGFDKRLMVIDLFEGRLPHSADQAIKKLDRSKVRRASGIPFQRVNNIGRDSMVLTHGSGRFVTERGATLYHLMVTPGKGL